MVCFAVLGFRGIRLQAGAMYSEAEQSVQYLVLGLALECGVYTHTHSPLTDSGRYLGVGRRNFGVQDTRLGANVARD